MRRSLAQSWREQRRARSGDVAWEESLWEKKWNYAERIQYTGGGWKGEGAFGIRGANGANSPGGRICQRRLFGGELSWPRSLQQARPNAGPKTIRRWANAGISSAQAPSQQLPYFRVSAERGRVAAVPTGSGDPQQVLPLRFENLSGRVARSRARIRSKPARKDRATPSQGLPTGRWLPRLRLPDHAARRCECVHAKRW